MINSPITNSKNIVREKTIATDFIIQGYKKMYGIDVKRFFTNLDHIYQYKCLDSGFRFFYPFTTVGDSKFYEEIEKFPWYYMDWKWEHQSSLAFIKKVDTVLEVGCGKGVFLKKLGSIGIIATGLELNENAVREGLQNGLHILNELIEDHETNNKGKYDVVCSFQVFEHVTDLRQVLQSSINVTKKGGKLIMSVPNNDSFLKNDTAGILNIPPHHMNLWDKNFLKKLAPLFNLRLECITYEPLQNYHSGHYYGIQLSKIKRKSPVLGKIISILLPFRFVVPLINLLRPLIKGHTIMAVYTKI